MARNNDTFEQFDRMRRNQKIRTFAGIVGGFVVFFGGIYYILAGSTAPASIQKNEPEHGIVQPSSLPEEMGQPAEIAQRSSPVPEPQPAQLASKPKKHKKTAGVKHHSSKKVAKHKKVVTKDNLVCIPPSKLKALERQVARSSRQ